MASLRVDKQRTLQHIVEHISSGTDSGGDGTTSAHAFQEASEEVLLAAEQHGDTKRFIEERLAEHGEWFERSHSDWHGNEEASTSNLQAVTSVDHSRLLGLGHDENGGDGSESDVSDDGSQQQDIRQPELTVPLPGTLPFNGPPRAGTFIMP